MSEAISVRTMAAADLDAVMAIADGLDTAPHWPRLVYESALDLGATPQRVALVAEVSGQVVGFAIASLIAPEAELETIAVSAAHQRQKAGSTLLAALFRELASRRILEVTLEVRASNVAAQEFYTAHSFMAFSRRVAYYLDTGEAAVLMRAPTKVRGELE